VGANAKDYLPKVQESLKLSRTAWSVFPGEKTGPADWGLNPGTDVTVIVADGKRVKASLGYPSTTPKCRKSGNVCHRRNRKQPSMIEPEGSPKDWPPLGLPVGSVRALLTLVIVAVVVSNLAQKRELDILWIETLLIALAHYFTSRRFVALPPAVVKRLEQEGVIDKERHPLFLPRHTIRTLILAAFAGLAIYLYREQRLFEPRSLALPLLGIVAAYVLGAVVRGISGWIGRWRSGRPSRLWGDAKAVVVLSAIGLVAVPEFLNSAHLLPPEVHKVALGLMLFYFGSR
jgi:hypothetical protein